MERQPQRRIGRIVLWATLGLMLLSCGFCSGTTLYATTVADAPLIVSAGNVHVLVMQASQFSPDSVYKVLNAPVEVGFSTSSCMILLGTDGGLKIGDYSIQSYSCGQK
jgi:hypothetical protein